MVPCMVVEEKGIHSYPPCLVGFYSKGRTEVVSGPFLHYTIQRADDPLTPRSLIQWAPV